MHSRATATIELDEGLDTDGLHERLGSVLERPEARVVLFVHVGASALESDKRGLGWLERYPLPTVFCFEGALEGAALGVGLACDIRVCGAAARMRWARPPGAAPGATRLELLLGGRLTGPSGGELRWTAAEALAAGLVSSVVEAGRAREKGDRVAQVIASRGPIATRLAKEAIWRGLEMPLAQGLRFETDLTLLLQTTKDRAEGVAAFLEKRPPQFTGE